MMLFRTADETFPPAEAASLHRRVHFAESCCYHVDALLATLGLRRGFWKSALPLWLANAAFDAVELLRTGKRPSDSGEPHRAALAAPIRLKQGQPYRSYWYDPKNHSLVGLLLALDLNHHEGKYYILESNTGAALRNERRALYDTDLDPLIDNLMSVAKARAFKRIILLRKFWTNSQLEEFSRVPQSTGVEIIPATLATADTKRIADAKGTVPVNPMLALPDTLSPHTIYVICSYMSPSPIFHFIHDKGAVSRWLPEAIRRGGNPAARLASVSTSDRLMLPAVPSDPRWPNLVVKIANRDKGAGVAMGRFSSETSARQQLRLHSHVPGILPLPLHERILNRFLPQRCEVLYQPFIPPDVIDGCAQYLRTYVFISPIVDAFLSAHGTLSTVALPDRLPEGLVDDRAAYIVKSATSKFRRLEPDVEDRLRGVALEFGRLARIAISAKFDIQPAADAVQS